MLGLAASMTLRKRALRLLILPVSVSLACAQQQAAAPSQSSEPVPQRERAQPAPARLERLAFGFRIRTLPFRQLAVMDNRMHMTTTFSGRTAYDYNASTVSQSPGVGGGAAFEFRLARRLRLTADLLFHRLRYESKTSTYSGTDDPATGNDERSQFSISEQTKARLWDLPVLVHYRGLSSAGLLSHVWVSGGVAARSISSVRTRAEIKNPDGSSRVDYLPAQPAHRRLLGVVIGFGFRFIDEFNIKVTPEVRFTRWTGPAFSSGTTRSPRGQLEIGVGFTR